LSIFLFSRTATLKWRVNIAKSFLYFILFAAGLFALLPLNQQLFLQINCFGNAATDYLFLLLTALADGFFIVLFILLLHPLRRGLLLPTLYALAAAAILVQIGKSWFSLPRPPLMLGMDQTCVLGHVFSTRSFPSGHSASVFVFVRYITDKLPARYSIPFFALGVTAAVSRAYVGVHFPVDIWTGAWIGYWTTDLMYRFFRHSSATGADFERGIFISSVTGILVTATYLLAYDEQIKELIIPLIPLSIFLLALFVWRSYAYGKRLFNK